MLELGSFGFRFHAVFVFCKLVKAINLDSLLRGAGERREGAIALPRSAAARIFVAVFTVGNGSTCSPGAHATAQSHTVGAAIVNSAVY
jgi:hypothetical protein